MVIVKASIFSPAKKQLKYLSGQTKTIRSQKSTIDPLINTIGFSITYLSLPEAITADISPKKSPIGFVFFHAMPRRLARRGGWRV